MKALSLGLLRGSIDQVAEIARINWVQPKVLDSGQIDGMRVRLREWDSSVNQLGNWIEGVGKDVWVSYSFRAMPPDAYCISSCEICLLRKKKSWNLIHGYNFDRKKNILTLDSF